MKEEIKEGYIRISDISSGYAGYGKVPVNILNYAADRGSRCHSLIADLLNDVVIKKERYSFCDKPLYGYIGSFKTFWKPYENSKILLQEERLYDHTFMTTGQPDLLIEHEGQVILIDWKCTSAVGKHWEIQAAGYDILIDAATAHIVDKTLFVKLDKDGKSPVVTEYKRNIDLFEKAHEMYVRFMQNQQINLEMD